METLDTVLADVWARLEFATTTALAAFHLGTLAGVDERGWPTVRVMVLRGVDREARALWCHTDARSSKVQAFCAKPLAAWCFYDAASRLQVRATGRVTVHTSDTVADAAWAASTLSSRRCYLAPRAPGNVAEPGEVNLPEKLRGRVPTIAESEPGRANFAVLRMTVEALDRLHLAAEGHARARFEFGEADEVEAWWVEA